MVKKIVYRSLIYLRSIKIRLKVLMGGGWIPMSSTIMSHPESFVILKSGVKIGRFVTITTLPNSKLSINENSIVNHLCTIYCAGEISIGENTRIAHGVTVVDHDYQYKSGVGFDKKNITNVVIGKNVWIGAGSIILKGTEIGDNTIIGAASLIKGKFKNKNQVIINEARVRVKNF